MISANEYFEKYLSWQRSESNLRTAGKTYESYTTMDLATLKPEAEAGNPAAQQELGERYLFGLNGLKQDPQQAKALFQQAADQGHPDGAHMLAEVHRTTEFGLFDYAQYFPLLKKAAEVGSWKAMFNLACAYYKGKDAYDGHGFDVDRLTALKWSTQCMLSTMELLEFYHSNKCGEGFQDYMQGVYALFVQSVCVSARQLLLGDGVPKDAVWAKDMLQKAQSFYRHIFGSDCPDFSALLSHCEE